MNDYEFQLDGYCDVCNRYICGDPDCENHFLLFRDLV